MATNKLLENVDLKSEVGIAAALEASRLAEKYGKDFFTGEDLTLILGIGLSNARNLMRKETFPTITVGNRKVVSAISFCLWTITNPGVWATKSL